MIVYVLKYQYDYDESPRFDIRLKEVVNMYCPAIITVFIIKIKSPISKDIISINEQSLKSLL